MARRSKIGEADRERILADYAAGMRVAQIAKKYGISNSYPGMLAARYGVRRPLVRPAVEEPAPVAVSLADVPVAEVRRLSGRGLGITAIAALLRCPYRSVVAALEA